MKLSNAVLTQLLGAAVVLGAGCAKESTKTPAAKVVTPTAEATPVEVAPAPAPVEAMPAIAAPVKPEVVQPPKHIAPPQKLAPLPPPPPQLVPHTPRIKSSGHDCPGCGMG